MCDAVAVPRVLLQLASVGVAIDLQEQLEAAGHEVQWDPDAAISPAHGGDHDVAILPAETADPSAIEAWRDREPAPGIVVIGPVEAEVAALGIEVVAHLDSSDAGASAVVRALERRFTARLSPAFARAALSLPRSLESLELAATVVRAARAAPAELVRAALRPHVSHYVASTPLLTELRQQRVLEVPEVAVLGRCDGTLTLQRVAAAAIEPVAAGRLLWSLASVGAVTMTAEPPDRATAARRRLAETREHLRRRLRRVERASPYDVLEVDRRASLDEIDAACQALGHIVAPERVGDLDLATLSEAPTLLWKQILEARRILYDPNATLRVDTIIDRRPGTYDPCIFGRADLEHREAERTFSQGQQALSSGDVFAAVSAMARAARTHPDHPVYETYLQWARYRAEVTRGGDKAEAARRGREAAVPFIFGRRPQPQALVAFALLCLADGDADAAHWHAIEASRLDPELPAARRLLARLG